MCLTNDSHVTPPRSFLNLRPTRAVLFILEFKLRIFTSLPLQAIALRSVILEFKADHAFPASAVSVVLNGVYPSHQSGTPTYVNTDNEASGFHQVSKGTPRTTIALSETLRD